MADLTMCADRDCPQASTCKRSEASGTKDSGWRQSWFATSPRTAAGCLFVWPTTDWTKGHLQPVTDRIEWEAK